MSDIQDYTPTGDDWTSRLGGLLGGPRDDTLTPIIGQQGLSNARYNALLNLGIGLMNAGGWQPHKVSTGQALAQGLAGAQQAYQGSLDNSLKGALTAQELQSKKLTMAQTLLMLKAAQRLAPRLVGGAAPDATAQGATPAPAADATSPEAAPAAQSSPVPTMTPTAMQLPAPGTGAVGAPAAPGVPNQPRAAAAAPMPSPQAPAPSSAGGIDPEGIKEYLRLAAMFQPQTARGVAAGLEPSLPDYKQLDDGTVVNMRDPSVAGTFHGKLYDNKAVIGPDGKVQLRPGVEGIERMLADAPARARAQYDYSVEGKAANGQNFRTTPVQVQQGGGVNLPPIPSVRTPPGMQAPGGGAPAPLPDGAAPAPAAQAGGIPPGAVPTSNTPVQEALATGGAKYLQGELDTSNKAAETAPTQLSVLYRNDQLLRQTKAGATAPAWLAVGKVLTDLGITSAKDERDVTRIQELYNNEANAVMGSLKANFPGRITNADLSFAMSSLAGKGQPAQAARVLNGINAAKVLEAQDYNRFVLDYAQKAKTGAVDPNGLSGAWQAHQAAAPSIWETPLLLNSGALPMKQSDKGTFVEVPGRGWAPVRRDASGLLQRLN